MLALGDFEVNGIAFTLITLALVSVFIPYWFLRDWFLQRWRIRRSKITILYEPPGKLTPAEILYLFSGLSMKRTVAATLVDLINKSYVHVEKRDGRKYFKLGPKSGSSSQHYEKLLLSEISEHGSTFEDIISKLDSEHIKQAFKSGVREALSQKSFISGEQVNKFFIRAIKATAALLVALIWLPLAIFSGLHVLSVSASSFEEVSLLFGYGIKFSLIFILPLGFLSLFVVKYRAKLLGRRWMATQKLNRKWPQLIGFKEYVGFCYRGKLNFASEDLRKKAKTSSLPYSIAFGYVEDVEKIVS